MSFIFLAFNYLISKVYMQEQGRVKLKNLRFVCAAILASSLR